MKKLIKLLAVPFIVATGAGVTSCAPNSSISGGEFTLRILNSEDYIYIQESEDDLPDMVDQFVEWVKTSDDERCLPFRDKNVKVVYDCSDTNETIYSELMTGKSNYDIINVSDYMAQKIVSGGYAVPIIDSEGTNDDENVWDEIPNYEQYASKNIKSRLDNIIAVQKKYDEEEKKWKDVQVALKDYAVGYTWGTLGILFNPYFHTGITPTSILDDIEIPGNEKLLEVINDMRQFDALWNSKYKGTITIKNSMRDTFAFGLLYAYREEFQAIRDDYLLAMETYEPGSIEYEQAIVSYNEQFSEIFSRCEQKDVDAVYNVLTELKGNIFGLEVDSGKQDIVTSKIGINLAWSGDAVYSMDQANDPEQVGTHLVDLCYAVPERGSNLWFDTWIMPNCPRSTAQGELARLFLDFMCDPINASQNMDYTGYTSFIGGNDIIELVRDWYDIRSEEVFYWDEDEIPYDIYRIDEEEETYELVTYSDCVSYIEEDYGHIDEANDENLYYFIPFIDEESEEEIDEPRSYLELIENGEYVPLEEEEEFELEDSIEEEEEITIKTYGDLWLADEEGYEEVDLTYFFKDTTDPEVYCDHDFIFYSDCYLPFSTDEEEQNIAVGRQFFCQYPDEEVFIRCAVMKDYGENNKMVMKMWENFKSNPLPTGSIVIFVVIILALLAILIYFIVNRGIKRSLRKKRKASK